MVNFGSKSRKVKNCNSNFNIFTLNFSFLAAMNLKSDQLHSGSIDHPWHFFTSTVQPNFASFALKMTLWFYFERCHIYKRYLTYILRQHVTAGETLHPSVFVLNSQSRRHSLSIKMNVSEPSRLLPETFQILPPHLTAVGRGVVLTEGLREPRVTNRPQTCRREASHC